uniref:Chemosensory protein n=1 Tax=Heliothis virescens TaxID=7102 RepID=D2SNX6_HELVI
MKCVYVLSFLLAVAAVHAEDKYSTENDDLDIDAVVANLASLREFVGCFMDAVTCNAIAADFKKDIPEAVSTQCAKCTDAQKHIFYKFLLGLKEKLPNDYQAFKIKYDPDNKHFSALEDAVSGA